MKDKKTIATTGFQGKSKTIVRHYDESLKRRVVEEVLIEGSSLRKAGHRFNVPHSSIRDWIKKYSSEIVGIKSQLTMTPEEENQFQALKMEKEQIAQALKDAQLKISGLETLIDVAEKELKITIRIKSGSKPSKS